MHRHVACVHLEPPERLHAHKRSFGRRSAFSRMGDLALQVLDGNWLEDVPVRMDPERVDSVIRIPGHEHDGASGAQLAHTFGKLQPVGISQADIQEGDVRGSALEERARFRSRLEQLRRFNAVNARQLLRQGIQSDPLVVHHDRLDHREPPSSS